MEPEPLEMDTDSLYMSSSESAKKCIKMNLPIQIVQTVRGMLYHCTRWEPFEDNRRGIGDNNQYQQ